MGLDNGEDYLMSEIEKTKKKLKEIGTTLESQQQLLRLIVQVSSPEQRFLSFFRHFFIPENGN